MRQGGNITTNATGTATGGNVRLNTDPIALLEDSSITANAVEGAGENIQIFTEAIFPSRDSAITASSQLGVDGIVNINTPEADATSGLVKLPENVVDPSN